MSGNDIVGIVAGIFVLVMAWMHRESRKGEEMIEKHRDAPFIWCPCGYYLPKAENTEPPVCVFCAERVEKRRCRRR